MKLGIKAAQGTFFDRDAVMKKLTKTERRVLSKFGAFVMTRAKGSIRKRKKPSRPGRPPSSHSGLLKKFIFFSYDPQTSSVIVGPALLDSKPGDAAGALERGGRSTRIDPRTRRRVPMRVERRPFMQPAFEAEIDDSLPDLWRDSIG